MKNYFCAAVVSAVLAFGVTAGPPVQADENRAARIMEIFTTYCVPDYSLGLRTKLRVDMKRFDQETGESPLWFDEPSSAFLYVDKNRCTITTSHQDPLGRADGLALKGLIDTYVPERFPELEFDPDATWGAADFSTVWMKGPAGSWDRWGIFSFVKLAPGEGQGLALAYVRHPDERN